jgi:hypothetical protein
MVAIGVQCVKAVVGSAHPPAASRGTPLRKMPVFCASFDLPGLDPCVGPVHHTIHVDIQNIPVR